MKKEKKMTKNTNKLTGKDIINIGIYSAILFVVVFAAAMLGMIPVGYPALTIVIPLVGGIVFELFLTKVKKFGMIWIMSLIMGALMLFTGMGYYPLIVSIISGFITEMIVKSGAYSSRIKSIFANGTFFCWVWGNYFLFYCDRDAFIASRAEAVGTGFTDAINRLLPFWTCPLLLVICFVSGIFGGLWGTSMLKKHLKKAGIE